MFFYRKAFIRYNYTLIIEVMKMYLPIQVSRTKVRTAYNKGLEAVANQNMSEYSLGYEGVVSAVRDLSVQVELAKMEGRILFA